MIVVAKKRTYWGPCSSGPITNQRMDSFCKSLLCCACHSLRFLQELAQAVAAAAAAAAGAVVVVVVVALVLLEYAPF